ncbi:MAG: MarC family protein [Anaerolineales bacterium]|jgi:multiple antibiotic resistance protein
MNPYSTIEIFTLLFATMGPIKVLITFAEKTQGLDKAVKRRIAINSVFVAAVVGIIFIFFGFLFMEVFKFSTVAMSLAGGLILLIYSIKSILKEPKPGQKKGYATDREAEQMAIYPLAIPLMASPMGLVTLTIVSANRGISVEDLIFLTIMLLVIMAINLVALLSVDSLSKYLSPETLEVANRILALLLAALAMETIVNGVGQLLQGLASSLQGR